MKKILLILVLIFPFTVFGYELSASEDQQLRAALDEHLRDAESARFKDIKFGEDGFFCGKVNAKNAYGAYAGYTYFMGMKLAGGRIYIFSAEPGSGEALCRDKGLL